MKLWLRKLSVILLTIVTLGFYIPPAIVTTDADKDKDSISDESIMDDNNESTVVDTPLEVSLSKDNIINDIDPIDEIMEQAREQTLLKLGPRIASEIDDEFTSYILPNMEKALMSVLHDEEGVANYFQITERPSDGMGERIFNVYDNRTKKDIALFHVRRDKRPLEGYWFNFHYHLAYDDFDKHHEIGEVYWDKNDPPKWMS